MSKSSNSSDQNPSGKKSSQRRKLPTPPVDGGSRSGSSFAGSPTTPANRGSRSSSPFAGSPTTPINRVLRVGSSAAAEGRGSSLSKGSGGRGTESNARSRVVQRRNVDTKRDKSGGEDYLRLALENSDASTTPGRGAESADIGSPQTPVGQIMEPYSPRPGNVASASATASAASKQGTAPTTRRKRRVLPTPKRNPFTSERKPRRLPTPEQRVPVVNIDSSNHVIISPSVPYSVTLQGLEGLLKQSLANRSSPDRAEVHGFLNQSNIEMAQQSIISGAEVANFQGYSQQVVKGDIRGNPLVPCFTFFNKRGQLKDAQLRLIPVNGNEAKLSYKVLLFDSLESNVPPELSAYFKSPDFYDFLESKVLAKINQGLEEDEGFYLCDYEKGLQGLISICIPEGQKRMDDGSGFSEAPATIAEDSRELALKKGGGALVKSLDLTLGAIEKKSLADSPIAGYGVSSIKGVDGPVLQKYEPQASHPDSMSDTKNQLGLLKMLFKTIIQRMRFDFFAADKVSSDSLSSLLYREDIKKRLFDEDKRLTFVAYKAMRDYIEAVEDKDLIKMMKVFNEESDIPEMDRITGPDLENNFSHAVVDSLKFQYAKMLHFSGFTSLAKLQNAQSKPDSLDVRYNFLDVSHLDHTLDFVSLHLVHRLKQVFSDSLKVYADADINGAEVENYKTLFLEKFIAVCGKCSNGIATDDDIDFLKSSFEIFDESEVSLGGGYSFEGVKMKFSLFSDLDPGHGCHNKTFLAEYKKEIGLLKSQGEECDEYEIWQKKFVNFFKRASGEYIEDIYPDIDITRAASSLCLMKNAFPEELLHKFLYSSWRVAALTDVCCGNIENGVKKYHEFVNGPLMKEYEKFIEQTSRSKAKVIDVFNGLNSKQTKVQSESLRIKRDLDPDQLVMLDYLNSLYTQYNGSSLEVSGRSAVAAQAVAAQTASADRGLAMNRAIRESVKSGVFALFGDSCCLAGGAKVSAESAFGVMLNALSPGGRAKRRLHDVVEGIVALSSDFRERGFEEVDKQLASPYLDAPRRIEGSPFADIDGPALQEASSIVVARGSLKPSGRGGLRAADLTRGGSPSSRSRRSLPDPPLTSEQTVGEISKKIVITPQEVIEYISQTKSRNAFLELLQKVELSKGNLEGDEVDPMRIEDALRGKILEAVDKFKQQDFEDLKKLILDNGIKDPSLSYMLGEIKSNLASVKGRQEDVFLDVSFSVVDESLLLPDNSDVGGSPALTPGIIEQMRGSGVATSAASSNIIAAPGGSDAAAIVAPEPQGSSRGDVAQRQIPGLRPTAQEAVPLQEGSVTKKKDGILNIAFL